MIRTPTGELFRRVHPLWVLAPAAIALRLLYFLGRGHYVAFDEGWYLLLGRNLFAGHGYTLAGLQHVALSPLFPVLAGALELVLHDAVWAGRVVAAVSAGLLVVPCWFIFRRLAGRRTALIGAGFVAVMPSLAPFTVPFWIGWDLWVGAEFLLHLGLYAGIALALRAAARSSALDWGLAGAAFALAYLARPEAVIPAGIAFLAATAMAVRRRRARALAFPLALAAAFAIVAAPYWAYLHGVTGHWTLTARGVAEAQVRPAGGAAVSARGTPDLSVESMLWDDEAPYARSLYALDASGTRLLNPYWGVPPASDTALVPYPPAPVPAPPESAAGRADPQGDAGPASRAGAGTPTGASMFRGPLRVLRTLGVLVPWPLWLVLIPGLVVPRRRWRPAEVWVTGGLLATSVAIALAVAVDPRTQLFLVPMLSFYAARGVRLLGVALDRRGRAGTPAPPAFELRRGFFRWLATLAVVLVLMGVGGRRLLLSLRLGSPHHVVAEQNYQVGRMLDRRLPPDATVMSWHPAIAVYARRDWRVLPYAPFPRIVTYANAVGCETVVISEYYPSRPLIEQMDQRYLILTVPPGAAGVERWGLAMGDTTDLYAFASLVRP